MAACKYLGFLTEGQRTQDIIQLAENCLKTFKKLDKSKDGVLTIDELEKICSSDAEAKRMFAMMDLDQSQCISEEEYVKFQVMTKMVGGLMPKFKEMDKNGDGTLTRDELRSYLVAQEYKEDRLDRAIEKADSNKDGRVDYMELYKFLHQL